MAIRDYVAKYVADLTGYQLTPVIRDTEKLERTSDQTADAVAADWRAMAAAAQRGTDAIDRDVDDSAAHTKRKLGETGREAGQEFTQNLGESISSGDLSSIASDTAGGLAATFGATGPIGIAFAGLATFAAMAFKGMQAEAEKVRKTAQGMFEDMLSGADKMTRFRTNLTNLFGDYNTGLDRIQEAADATGLSVKEIGDAFAEGGPTARRLAAEMERIEAAGSKVNAYSGEFVQSDQAQIAGAMATSLERAAVASEQNAKWAKTHHDAIAATADIIASQRWQQNLAMDPKALAAHYGYTTGRRG